MGNDMRRLMTFDCEGASLAASLDEAEGETGLLLLTGGSQTRVGSHRMYERLAKSLAKNGISCLRFDRRGVGDSAGEDPGFRGSGPDIRAAVNLLRSERPSLRRIYGFGLCDGATALALFGGQAGLDGILLVNPWLVEAQAGDPPAAAIGRRYRERLASLEGWRDLLSGRVNYRKLFRGMKKLLGGRAPSPLAADVAAALRASGLRSVLILATGDATAIAAEAELATPAFRELVEDVRRIDSNSHTFARPGDAGALAAAVLDAVRGLESAEPSSQAC